MREQTSAFRSQASGGHRALVLSAFLIAASSSPALAQAPVVPSVRVTVNSNQDGAVQADQALTLREAIAIVNGILPLDKLSTAEQAQVESLTGDTPSQIAFKLPEGQTTIRLVDVLPALQRPGLVIDGTTQPGYQAAISAINELPMPVPVVAIAPAEGKEVFRGLTVAADGIVIRGLSLYGFTSTHQETASTPPADIFITHRLPPPDISKRPTPANFAPYYKDDMPAQNVVIENNWLGLSPTSQQAAVSGQPSAPTQNSPRSAFGVSVFDSVGTTIRRNWIADHDGSAIITSVKATNLQVSENVITGNGVAGMPDAIRLEGAVDQSQITGNLICANDGSGVYLFKPSGAVQVKDNQIIYNGRRLRRAAVYLMGSNHQVTGNQIRYQAGPGIVVAAYPASRQNQIETNRFSNLEGLSIDLVTQQGTGAFGYADPVVDSGTDVYAYQRGDGANPLRDTPNRRKETGNDAIDAPQFASKEFFILNAETAKPSVQISGKADPGSKIELYQVSGKDDGYGPLSEPIATTETDAKGNFSTTIAASPDAQISAIATDARYGTSEPARIALVRSLDPSASPAPTSPQPPTSPPRCTTPVAQQPPAPEPPPKVVRLTVPKNIHFALDQFNISAATAKVLDRIAQVLVENPYILVNIEGHTDPRASDAYNLQLGKNRAIAARNYLLRRGIAPERMTIRSLGERQPISPGKTRIDYARDRRAEFIYRDARDIEVIIQEQDLQIEP
ncbi:cell envelope biogenesis protein OmpA [Stenomitos frigidus ULC18]|uniref:Cell envelope biogenesis protein OmpA n=2 Tax=Stenomitos TaxID=1844270 RepID=A0A2T1ESN3_9CYAN|nr:cell envelope biogenesis protein OmpA [Stenomitos frigidus ULC18]